MPRVRLVLVRPERAANVGAVARVVRNAGLEGLDLVAPGDWRTVECWRTAWGAQEVLEQARVFDALAPALDACALVVGLSGRRDGGIAPLDVRDAASAVAALGDDERAALVLGPERIGLDAVELALCGLRARIPAHPGQPSLNLSHAAAIAAYELYRAGSGAAPPGPRTATHGEKERMLALLEPGLRGVGALPPHAEESHMREWRSLFHRAPLTPRHVTLLEHLARRLALLVRGGEGEG